MKSKDSGNPKQGLCSIPEAAKFLSLSRAKVYQAMAAGEIPSKRIGARSIRIPWAWLHAQAEVEFVKNETAEKGGGEVEPEAK